MGNDLECQSKTRQRTACLKLSISSTYIKKMVKKTHWYKWKILSQGFETTKMRCHVLTEEGQGTQPF